MEGGKRGCVFALLLAVVLAVFVHPMLAEDRGGVDPDACMAACDAQHQTTPPITVCGTDLLTHNTYEGAFEAGRSCYDACGVGFYHVGPCGCPNYCYEDLGRGTCADNSTTAICQCNSGWGGADCSSVSCPNPCSGNGACINVNALDVCQCATGWTGSDCSVQVETIMDDALPYGEIVPGVYYQDDKYNDKHPVFRPSLVASVRITLPVSDLLYCLLPVNAYNQSWVMSTFYFYNNEVNTVLQDVGIRIKGAVSRRDAKKSWTLKLNTNGSGRSWKSLKGIGLKSASAARVVSNQLILDYYRAMNVQTYRTSFTEFWINDIYFGLYTLQEKFDDMFLQSRFGAKNSYLYKFGLYDLTYKGPEVTTYEQLVYGFDPANPIQCIEQSEGDGNWTTLVDLITSVHDLTVEPSFFNVDVFIRAMMLEAFTQNFDGYTGNSNNYLIANGDAAKVMWTWVAQDFDFAMSSVPPPDDRLGFTLPADRDELLSSSAPTVQQLTAMSMPTNVFQYAFNTKPLSQAVFSLPNSTVTYYSYVENFMAATKDLWETVAIARLEALVRLATPALSRDRFYSASGQNMTQFQENVDALRNWIPQRFTNVSIQLANALASTSATVSTSAASTGSHDSENHQPGSGSSAQIAEGVVGGVLGAGLLGFIALMAYTRIIKPYKDHSLLKSVHEDEL